MPDSPQIPFSALMTLLRRHLQAALAGAGISLSPPQGQLLGLIAASPGISPQALAAATGRDKAQITRHLAALEAYIQRQSDPKDARRQCLSLNQQGQSLASTFAKARQQAQAAAFAPLTDAERRQLAALIGKCLAPGAEPGNSAS